MAAGKQLWSSRFGFLMASVGFAVGLGNIWRFPYVTGENGGSAFVVVYLLCVFGIGVPILMAEIMLGRRGGLSPPSSVRSWAMAEGRSTRWSGLGYLNLLTALAILVAYGVVAGWVLSYLAQGVAGGFAGLNPQQASAGFDVLLADTPAMLGWTALALAVSGGIVYAGVEKGIERAVVVLMPLLFLLMLGLVVFNVLNGGMQQTLEYLFKPDFSRLSPAMVLAAVGQAFFSISVAMAGMMMYGAYLPREVSIGRSAVVIVVADTAVALLAGLVIFPIVFNNGLDPAGGTGLIFKSLPAAFAQMPGGYAVGAVFFLLLSVAAITSVVGLLEPLVAWIEERFRLGRHVASAIVIAVAMAGGSVSALSFNAWSDVQIGARALSSWIDFVPNQILLPVGGLLIAVFAGWLVKPMNSREELGLTSGRAFLLWFNLLRWAVVPAVFIILITGVMS